MKFSEIQFNNIHSSYSNRFNDLKIILYPVLLLLLLCLSICKKEIAPSNSNVTRVGEGEIGGRYILLYDPVRAILKGPL